METKVLDVESKRQSILKLLALFEQKENELRQVGEVYLGEISRQSSILISKINTNNPEIAVAIVAANLAIKGGTYVYQKIQLKKLQGERKEFALNNVNDLEEIGVLFKAEIEKAFAYINITEKSNNKLLNLDKNSLKVYKLTLFAYIRYQYTVFNLLEKHELFCKYYKHIVKWAERESKPDLLKSSIDIKKWISDRVESAKPIIENSTSISYNFSLPGHLLLFINPDITQSLAKFQNKAKELADSKLQRLTIDEKKEYLKEIRSVLAKSQIGDYIIEKINYTNNEIKQLEKINYTNNEIKQLEKINDINNEIKQLNANVEKVAEKSKKKGKIYKMRYWIISFVVLVVLSIIGLFTGFLYILKLIFQSLFG